jgi:hypothetical protein
MRFPSPVAVVVFLLMLGLAGPVDAKGGKGGGGGGHSKPSVGGGQKAHGGGQGGGSKHQVAQSKKPATDKFADGKPDKDKAAKDKDKVAKDKDAKDKVAKDKSAKEKIAKDTQDDADEPADDTDEADETTPFNKKEKQLANFQRQRDKKLAQAEHLRQIAERNGNANLAANADRMEAQAYEQYARKVSHLEKFGVTDPALDLDGDGFADPYVPNVDPLDDPLSDPLIEDALGALERLLPFGR